MKKLLFISLFLLLGASGSKVLPMLENTVPPKLEVADSNKIKLSQQLTKDFADIQKGEEELSEKLTRGFGVVQPGYGLHAGSRMPKRPMLLLAALYGKKTYLDYLLAHSSRDSINEKDVEGDTALHWAARGGSYTTVQKLLHAGALQLKNSTGETPLILANSEDHLNVVVLLSKDPSKKSGHLSELLRAAAHNNQNAVVKYLLNLGADKDELDVITGHNALDNALEHNALDAAKVLYFYGAKPSCDHTALCRQAIMKKWSTIRQQVSDEIFATKPNSQKKGGTKRKEPCENSKNVLAAKPSANIIHAPTVSLDEKSSEKTTVKADLQGVQNSLFVKKPHQTIKKPKKARLLKHLCMLQQKED